MTTDWSIIAERNRISITWKAKIKPEFWIKHTATCRTELNFEPYLEKHKLLSSKRNSFDQTRLKDWSVCYFTITLVFNPASLDPGKSIHAFTGVVWAGSFNNCISDLFQLQWVLDYLNPDYQCLNTLTSAHVAMFSAAAGKDFAVTGDLLQGKAKLLYERLYPKATTPFHPPQDFDHDLQLVR